MTDGPLNSEPDVTCPDCKTATTEYQRKERGWYIYECTRCGLTFEHEFDLFDEP